MTKIHVLDTSEGAQAQKEWELSKYTTQELKDELASREDYRAEVVTRFTSGSPKSTLVKFDGIDIPEQNEVCKHDMEMGYCPVKGCPGGY